MKIKKTLGKNIQKLRLRKNLSIDDLKSIFFNYEYPTSRKTIYRWERDEVIPDLKAITILCDIYKVPASHLIDMKTNLRTQMISKYETRFIFALRTDETYRKILNKVIKKEKTDAIHWKEIENVKKEK